MKQLTLDLAATSFLGAGIVDSEGQIEITRSFVDMVAAAVAVIRRPLPGTQTARGVKGCKRIAAYFSEQILIRREKDGEDLPRNSARPPMMTAARCCRTRTSSTT